LSKGNDERNGEIRLQTRTRFIYINNGLREIEHNQYKLEIILF